MFSRSLHQFFFVVDEDNVFVVLFPVVLVVFVVLAVVSIVVVVLLVDVAGRFVVVNGGCSIS